MVLFKNKEDKGIVDEHQLYGKNLIEENAKKKKKIDLNKEISFKRIKKAKKIEEAKPKSVNLVGIDVGTYEVKVVEGRYKGDKLHISNMFKFNSPLDMYKDGCLVNQDILVLKLKNQLKRAGVKTKNISLVSASSMIINREITVPYVENAEELRNLVSYEVQQYLCINLNNYDIQYMIIDDFVQDDVRKLKLFTVIYPKNIADGYKDLCTKLLLNPYALDISNNAVRKVNNFSSVYNSSLIEKGEPVMYMDMGHESINLTIVNNDKIEFIRTIPIGGKEISEYISDIKNISLDEAEKLKKEEVNVYQYGNSEISSGVCEILDGWIMDISRILQFYTTKSGGKKVNKIYLLGGGSKLKGLPKYIEEKLQIQTSVIRTIDCIETGRNINAATVEEYVNAIGSLIRL